MLTALTLTERMRVARLFVAVTSVGEIVGTIGCAISGDEGHIRGMAVLPAWQGRSVAGALLNAAEQECLHLHCRRISLDTTAPLDRAMRFYERHGYRRSGNIGDFFGMPLFEYVKFCE